MSAPTTDKGTGHSRRSRTVVNLATPEKFIFPVYNLPTSEKT
jgi:hypothetical protein